MANKKNNANVNLKGILNTLEDTAGETNTDTSIDPNTNTDTNTNENTVYNTTGETNMDTDTNSQGETPNFKLKKKVDDKKGKKAFNVYMTDDLIKALDKVCKKSGHSRNELINLMCDYCVKNLELIEE